MGAAGQAAAEAAAIRYSLEAGQNHIDTAEMYGDGAAEAVVGKATQSFKREDLYIASKIWKTHLTAGTVRPAVQAMLQRLNTDYLDMLYIHAPWEGSPWPAAIPQICDLIDEGTVRHFAVSNFTIANMQQAKSLTRHPITANQMNFNVLYQAEVDQEFRDFCQQHDIKIVAYQPIKRGEVSQSEALKEIAKKHAATPAQVALAWLVQLGALPIPKAVQKAHIDDNLRALNLKLTKDEIARLNNR